jgi:hypothetical protein
MPFFVVCLVIMKRPSTCADLLHTTWPQPLRTQNLQKGENAAGLTSRPSVLGVHQTLLLHRYDVMGIPYF